jgi:heme/copper-type cytochrome/quinol oxidase subunit 4
MSINKAIRKQKQSYIRFMLAMCFIFFIMPLSLYFSRKLTLFFIIYLIVIEIMVLLSVFLRMHTEKLKFSCEDEKLRIRDGLFRRGYVLACDKVVLVHTEKQDDDIQIVLVTSSRFRNKKIKEIDLEFLRKHAYLSHEYTRIKKIYPENNYYYILVKNGGYNKYKLLSEIYKNCVRANYTDDTVENIKKGRL